MTACRLLLILIALFSFSSVQAQTLPPLKDYFAEVEVKVKRAISIKAKGTIEFTTTDNNWTLNVQAKSGPLTTSETSSGEWINNIYRPNDYKRRFKVLFVKENIDWIFDWDQEKVSGSVNGDRFTYPLTEIMHDQISFQLPLRTQLALEEKAHTFTFLRYKKPGTLKFEVIGEELLTLESGRVHTLILKQLSPLSKGEKKLIWVAKDLDYIPVRFTTYKNNKIRDDILVTKLWIDGKPVVLKP